MDTLTTSGSLTSVKTANGEVQTREEARVYVKELDMFMKVKIFEDTPAVFSFGKFCEDHGYSYEWTNGQTPCFIKNSRRRRRVENGQEYPEAQRKDEATFFSISEVRCLPAPFAIKPE